MVKYLIIMLILVGFPATTHAKSTNKNYDKIVAEWGQHLIKQRNTIHSMYKQGKKKCSPRDSSNTTTVKNGCYPLYLEEWTLGLKKVDTKYSKMFKVFGKNKVR
jgi:hypothetical protein